MVGMIVGIIPGFGPSAGLAILLPVTFGMDPIGAVMMLAAIYYGAMYGGTITSILLNTPGESATVASTFDGYPLAQQGRAGPALVMQAVASFVGGTVGVIMITLLPPLFSQVARNFGPPEYFLLAMMGLLTLVVMIGANWRYGLISALIGFALGTVGVDLETGQGRFTFGSAELIGGIDFIPIAIGLFGLGELYYAFYQGLHATGSGAIVQYTKRKPLLARGARLDRDADDDGARLAPGLRRRRHPRRRRDHRLAHGLFGRALGRAQAAGDASARARWPASSGPRPPTTPPRPAR